MSAVDPLTALRVRFLERCVGDLATIRSALRHNAPSDDPSLSLIVHRLAGTAGTFGYWEISHLASPIDDLLQSGARPPCSQLEALAEALQAAL